MMNDDELAASFGPLAPTAGERHRMEARVFAWLEAHDTPLALEWLQLLKASPLSALGLGAVSAVSIAATPPFVWLARALL
jgi:hypothetical protein